MKAACPRCGKTMILEQEAGDFPSRCTRCGAMVRRRPESPLPADEPMEAAPDSKRIQRGMLAGLLISHSMETPTIVHARPAGAVVTAPARGVLRPESRREVLRAKARQKAIARAELRGNQQALGALTWAGLVLVGIIGLGALALKAHDMWRHPTPSRGDVLQVQR